MRSLRTALVLASVLAVVAVGRSGPGSVEKDAREEKLDHLEAELSRLEQSSLQRWTAAVADSHANNADASSSDRIAQLHRASDFLREQRRVVSFLRSELEKTQEEEHEAGDAEEALARTQQTLQTVTAAIRRASSQYASFNQDAQSEVSIAVEDFLSQMAPLQRAATQWQMEARANATQLQRTLETHSSRLWEERDKAKRRASLLRETAAAAGRLLVAIESGAGDPTALVRTLAAGVPEGMQDPWPARARDDLAHLEDWDTDMAAAAAALRAADRGFRQRHALWSAAHSDANQGVNGSAQGPFPATGESWPTDLAWDVESVNSASVRMLLRSIRSVLGSRALQRLKNAQNAAGEERNDKKGAGEGGGRGAGGAEEEGPWGALEDRKERLAAARRVLEAELWRRASRGTPDSWWEETRHGKTEGGDEEVHLSRGKTSKQGSTPESNGDDVTEAAIAEIARSALRATSVALSPGSQGLEELTRLAQRGTGTLWTEADALEREVARVQAELDRCKEHPEEFREGCASRLEWEIDRLREENAHRRTVALGAWGAWANVRENVHAANRRCTAQGKGDNESGDTAQDSEKKSESKGEGGDKEESLCGVEAMGARSLLLRSATRSLESGKAAQDAWAERVELRCFWTHRSEPITPLVARSLDKPAEGEGSDAAAEEARQTSGDEAAIGPRLQRLWRVCGRLSEAPLKHAPGAEPLRKCLCPSAENVRKWWVAVWSAASNEYKKEENPATERGEREGTEQ